MIAPSRFAPETRGKKPGNAPVIIPQKPSWPQRLGATLLFMLIRCVSVTIRYEWRDESGFLARHKDQAVIFCIWHNRLALCLEIYRRYLSSLQRPRSLAAMVSASKDGGFLARVLEFYRVQPVRGSTSRRGRQALLELTTWAERGHDLAITPDGPRGPCYRIQDGVMSLAQVTGLPILPVSYELPWKWQIRSWDKFQVPLPFSRCIIHLGPLVRVPRDATDAEREKLRLELERLLTEVTRD